MPEISIIIPVYNTGKYLKRCIESVLNQTFTNIEVILVDDGSTDGSGKICDEYLSIDSRVKVIHKNNGGSSSSRNAGMLAAEGNYLGFIDSDDYIHPDMYRLLYDNICSCKAEISICGILTIFKNKKFPQCNKDGFWVFSAQEALAHALEGGLFSVNAVNKLFKRELFKNIFYPEEFFSAEDAVTIPIVISSAKKIVFDSKTMYYYIKRQDSLTTSKYKPSDLDVIKAYELNLALVRNKFPSLEKRAMFRYLWSYIYALDKMVQGLDKEYIEEYNKVSSFLTKNTFNVLLNPYFSLKRKIMSIVLFLNKTLYSKIVIKNSKKNFSLYN